MKHSCTKGKAIWWLFLLIVPFGLAARREHRIIKNRPADISAIIFDLSGVLFKENKTGFAQKIGFGALAGYTLTHWKNPIDTCLDTLATMSCDPAHKPENKMKIKERAMPQCVVDLFRGTKNCLQTRNEINRYIQQLDNQGYFSSATEKTITQNIVNLILDPEQIPHIIKTIMPTVKLARTLKKAGYKLYILANLPHEPFHVLTETYPDIIELFDGIVISSQVNIVKPNTQIFSDFLDKYQLNPDECIFIDEHEKNIAAAEEIGITGIIFNKPAVVTRKLKQLGVRI